MQEIIIGILERLGFPTKNAKRMLPLIEGLNHEEMLALSIVTNDTEIIGTSDGFTIKLIKGGTVRMCALGGQLSARLKGGEG
jgi:hypothetical protein